MSLLIFVYKSVLFPRMDVLDGDKGHVVSVYVTTGGCKICVIGNPSGQLFVIPSSCKLEATVTPYWHSNLSTRFSLLIECFIMKKGQNLTDGDKGHLVSVHVTTGGCKICVTGKPSGRLFVIPSSCKPEATVTPL